MYLLQNVQSGMVYPDWHAVMHSFQLQSWQWIYCPGHTRARGNETTDWQAQQTPLLVCSLARQKSREVWGTFWTRTDLSTTVLIIWKKGKWRRQVADIPSSKTGNDLFNHTNINIVSNTIWGVVICWLLNDPATPLCGSGTDLIRPLYMLPHWKRSCRSNYLTQSQYTDTRPTSPSVDRIGKGL